MKRITNYMLLLVSSLLLSACAGPGQKIETPRVNLVSLQVIEIQLLEQRFDLTLRIQNPNREALTIDGISFAVELNGKEFAHGVDNQRVTIPAFGEVLTEVEVVSTLFGLVDQLRNLDPESGEPVSYRIHGNISLSGHPLSIPFQQKGRIGGEGASGSEGNTIPLRSPRLTLPPLRGRLI